MIFGEITQYELILILVDGSVFGRCEAFVYRFPCDTRKRPIAMHYSLLRCNTLAGKTKSNGIHTDVCTYTSTKHVTCMRALHTHTQTLSHTGGPPSWNPQNKKCKRHLGRVLSSEGISIGSLGPQRVSFKCLPIHKQGISNGSYGPMIR